MAEIIDLWGLNQKGKSAVVTAQRHLNLYAEIVREKEKARVSFYGTPGLDLFSETLGDTPIRGWIAAGDVFYLVHLNKLYECNNGATMTLRGTLSTSVGKVCLAFDGSVVLIVDGTAGYTYTLATTNFATIGDVDFPNGANTCDWLDGYFIVDDGSGDTFWISPDGTNWDALDFATAESNPDGIVRVYSDNGEVILGGAKTIEFWGNTGGADFPFSPIKGSTVEYGLVARWSLCKFNSGIAALLTPASTGQCQVMFIRGYVPTPISTPELDFIINNYADVSDAVAFSYLLGGHPMLQINFPSANASWLYDAMSGLWSPLESGLTDDRHRAELQLSFVGRSLVSDYETGEIYEIAPETYTDNGEAIPRELVSRHVFNNNDRVVVDELYLDMETGVGLPTGQGSDPVVMLQVSKDNGRSWGAVISKGLGAMGEYFERVVWRRLGVARDWTFKVRVTDPVKVVFTYGAIKART